MIDGDNMNAVKILLKKFTWVVIILLAAAGCSPAAAPAPTGNVTALAPGIPDGTYAIDTNKLKFEGSHFTLLTEFDQEIAQGSFVVNGNRVKFSETDFAPECGAEYSPYSYQWSFDGKALTFSNPDDKCGSRPDFMMAHPWVLK